MRSSFVPLILLVVFVNFAYADVARDYLRLRDGRIVEGVILRHDTAAVVLTSWENRHLRQPPLTVYTRDEVHSIWFSDPRAAESLSVRYVPHAGAVELGGSVLFQTWMETRVERRHLIQFGLQGGYAITRALAIDLSADISAPLGGAADSSWNSYSTAYQVSMSAVVQPFMWRGMIPYVLAGGGAALGIPVDGTILSTATDVRSLVNAGLGLKWGLDHLGMRVEWRHHFYTWTPDAVDELGLREREQTADASVIRVGLFYFR